MIGEDDLKKAGEAFRQRLLSGHHRRDVSVNAAQFAAVDADEVETKKAEHKKKREQAFSDYLDSDFFKEVNALA
ncbi:MAG: hypothetical protein LBE35_09040 [Clostridiales bacterium]|jgi:hypothetical protein|nr:hypothetical protein [Clostridiales bacterium]